MENFQLTRITVPNIDNGDSNGDAGNEIEDDQSPNIQHHLPTSLGSCDIQKQFEIIKDLVSRQTLPQNLKVYDSSTGIKNECRPALKVIQKTARYAETALKVLASLESPTPTTLSYDNKDINNLYCVLAAQINFLQSEFSSILVKSNFNDETSRIFRSLEASNTSFSQQSLNNLRVSAELAAVSSRAARG